MANGINSSSEFRSNEEEKITESSNNSMNFNGSFECDRLLRASDLDVGNYLTLVNGVCRTEPFPYYSNVENFDFQGVSIREFQTDKPNTSKPVEMPQQVAIQDKPGLPRMESVERISKLPVVEQTVDLATNLYGKVKESNTLVNSVLTTAETTVKGAVDKTLPVTARLEGPIKKVDSLLCSSLDFVENKIPAVKLPPDEMYKNTKDYVYTLPGVKCACQIGEQGVKRAVECACAVSQYGTQKLNNLKDCLAAGQTNGDEKEDPKNVLGVYLLTAKRLVSLMSSWLWINVHSGITAHADRQLSQSSGENAINEQKETHVPNGNNALGCGINNDSFSEKENDVSNHNKHQ